MPGRYFEDDIQFMRGSVLTYQKATRLMREIWERTVGEPLVLGARQPLARFEEALACFDAKLKQQTSESRELEKTLLSGAESDPAVDDLLRDTLNGTADARRTALDRDMDIVPPRICTKAILATAKEKAGGAEVVTLSLREFLRAVMAKIATEMEWSTPLRVGDNRHFPRSWQWLWEVCEASYVDDNYGLRVINTRGPVPNWPSGPGDLRVRIDPGRI